MAEIRTCVKSFESWLKLTFRLLVGDHWAEISEQVLNGDLTYRWCREMIKNSLFNWEHSAEPFLSGSVTNIKNEIWALRYASFEKSEHAFSGFSVWETTFTMACDLIKSLSKVEDKLCALKIAIVAGTFCDDEEWNNSGLKESIFRIFFSLKDESGGTETSEDVNEAFYIFVDFLNEFKVNSDDEKARMDERIVGRRMEWKKPESWCFGDFGKKDGQMEYPSGVLVNKQGDFLVLEQDSKGKDTIQRLQLFNKKGLYQKTLIRRDGDDVASMIGMALDNTGNVVVTLKDAEGIGRVNVYDMQGELVLAVRVLNPSLRFPSFFTYVAVDSEGSILVVEFHEMAVHIYDKNGEFVSKFGEGGRTAQPGVFENISCLSVAKNNEIFICDPFRSVQVFNSHGKFLRYFKSSGNIPTHVVVGETEVYCLYRDAHALEVYSLDGAAMLRKAGGFGWDLGRLWTPLDIARTSEGSIAVAEKESHRIQVLKI